MVRDRLNDLQAIRGANYGFGIKFPQSMNMQKSQNKKLNDILDQAQQIRSLIESIEQNVSIFKRLQNDLLSHTNTEIQKELETRIATISRTSHAVKTKLNAMNKSLDLGDMESHGFGFNSCGAPIHVRVHAVQYSSMVIMYTNVIMDFNESLLNYHNKCNTILQKQKTLMRKNITSEEFERFMDSEETQLFVENILYDTRMAKQQLTDIKNRHEEVRKLEKSITEVRDMFMEVAFLVEKQGAQIDSVEYFAEKAINNIDSGRTDLASAKRKQQKYRRRKIKIIIIISLIISFFVTLSVLSEWVF